MMKMSRRTLLANSLGALAAAPAFGAETPPPAGERTVSTAESGPVCLTDFEPLARKQLSHMAFEFIAAGAGDEITLRWNREAYDHMALRPRVLASSGPVDLRVTLFDETLPHPILLAPTAFHRLAHPEGEVATARGAGGAGALFVVSSFTTRRLRDIAKASTAPLWFQFFDLRKDRQAMIRDIVQEADGLGCKAFCITVDAPTTGPRNRQERAGFKIPDEFETPYYPDRQKTTMITGLPITGGFGWSDIERVLGMTQKPVLLKGILDPEDADRAIRLGVKGIIVSNHGGRCLDTLPATITALPALADRVAGRVPILVDGGIRRGTDIMKALALGARAVLIGRPYLWGLAVDGPAGVTRVVNILKQELGMAMELAGKSTLNSIDRSVLW